MPRKKQQSPQKNRRSAAPESGKSSAPASVADASDKVECTPSLRTSSLLAWPGFALALLLAIAWVISHSYLVDAVTVKLCDTFDQGIAPEKRMPLFLSEIAFDGYVWNRHAEKLGENGNYRLRFTDFDNAPEGREVHWNSAFAWYLRGLGELHYAFTKDAPGASLRNSIFRMSIWANPILLVAALLIFSTLTALRFGPLSGTVIALAMVCVPTFYEGFMPAYPDHHGLISFFLLGMLFGIAWAGAGWINKTSQDVFAPPHSLRSARHGMIFSALCGAAGLWFSALSTSLVLGTLGIAAVVSTPFFLKAGRRAGLEYHPELWKTWALWGGGGSLAFYLLEYFPNHISMRLEVNHPVYSIAFLGGGWAIYALTSWFAADRKTPFPWRSLVLCAIAGALLPLLILFGGAAVYIPNDPFMGRLWKNIAELLPLLTRIQLGGLTWAVAFGWFPVLLLAVIVLQFVRGVDPGTKAVLVFMGIPIVLLTALQFYQVRWGLLVGPLYGALAAIVIPQVWRLVPRDTISRSAGALLLLAFAYLFVEPAFKNSFAMTTQQYRAEPGKVPISPGQGLALLHRQMARSILDDAGDRPVVLLSSPNSSCMLSALGGFRTIGTLYWENVDGLKHAARALNAQGDEETLRLLQKHGVTHVSMMTWENFIEPYFRILYPDTRSMMEAREEGAPAIKAPENSFGIRALFNKTVPPFTRPLAFPKNTLSNGLQQTVLMLRVDPEQSIASARFHLARFIRVVEDNPVRAEFELRELENNPEVMFDVNAELGALYLSQKRYESALSGFLKALDSRDPKFREGAAAFASRGFLESNQLPMAKEVVRKAAASDSATLDTLMNSAWFLCTIPDFSLRDPASAAGWIERAEKMPGADPAKMLLLRAACSGAENQYEKAGEFAHQALEKSRNNQDISEAARQMIDSFSKQEPWVPGPAR